METSRVVNDESMQQHKGALISIDCSDDHAVYQGVVIGVNSRDQSISMRNVIRNGIPINDGGSITIAYVTYLQIRYSTGF